MRFSETVPPRLYITFFHLFYSFEKEEAIQNYNNKKVAKLIYYRGFGNNLIAKREEN